MTNLLTTVAMVCYAATCFRLLCYHRGRANFRVHISALAWLLIACTGTSALEILLGNAHATPGQSGLAIILCILVYRAQGNVANILRGSI